MSTPDDHILKKNIQKIFENRVNEIKSEENRWDELALKTRNSELKNQISFKNIDGFVPIYEKPGGVEAGDLNFKLISSPASEKDTLKYKNSWERSEYFNIWMRKECNHPQEIYMTKLMNLYDKIDEFFL